MESINSMKLVDLRPGVPAVAVVGAGAAGVSTAIRLADRHVPVDILLIDPCAAVGRGRAYGTTDRRHLLNVRADKMSVDERDPSTSSGGTAATPTSPPAPTSARTWPTALTGP
ncbi:hypothetical protein GCM10029964_078460 [Kibdelosporangium lantanae]